MLRCNPFGVLRDLGPLPTFALPLALAVLGAAAGWWIETQIRLRIRKRQLRKQGFTADDLASQESYFKKLGEITAAKIPERISFQVVASYSWSDPVAYEKSKAAFESLGFQRNSTFVAAPQKWVVEFWLNAWPCVCAKIIDSSERGIYSEISVTKADGSMSSFENTDDCGLHHREPDRWTHCGSVSPAQLLERALREGTPGNGEPMTLTQWVSAYEQSVNEYLAWRKSAGITADEVRRTLELRKKRRS